MMILLCRGGTFPALHIPWGRGSLGGNIHPAENGMYGYQRTGSKLFTGDKAIQRVHVLHDGVPLCGVPVDLITTDYKMGKPICRNCQRHVKKNEKLERLQDAVGRSQELFA
jgi:hypothetical protein